MTEQILLGIATIAVLGIGAQWLAWRFRVPSILLLLVFGFLVGNLTDLVRPDELFGDLLFPVVSLSVAIILFEGGLSLRYSEAKDVGATVSRLLMVGTAVTWAIATLAGVLLLGFEPLQALLVGAILVVTGPTVIMPMLRHVRPTGRVGPILKWEGIAIDPIGAMLTVLVFEAIVGGRLAQATTVALTGVAKTILAGGLTGAAAAFVLRFLLRRYYIPDYLQNPVALLFVVASFAGSNHFQEESGLLAAPLIGLILANSRNISIRHIVEFEENLRVLLLAGLFIVLGARVRFDDLLDLNWKSYAFLGVLILIARPLAVAASTIGSGLTGRERVFLAAMAPRGVVAAAVSSLYAIRLEATGRPFGARIVPEVFLVIVGTVAFYGLASTPLARALGVAKRERLGVLIVGAYAWAREMARALQDEGQEVLLVDTNYANVRSARMAGLRAEHADALSVGALEHLDLDGVGRLLAMTSNEEFNSLAALHFAELFGRSEVYQLPHERKEERKEDTPHHLRGRFLFGPQATFAQLTVRFAAGAQVRTTPITDRFDFDAFRDVYGNTAVPLFLVTDAGDLVVFTTDSRPTPRPGQMLLSVVDPAYASRTQEQRQRRTLFKRPGAP